MPDARLQDDGSGSGSKWLQSASRGGNKSQYCAGILRSITSEGASWGHSGGTLGFSSRVWWEEGGDVAVAAATNLGAMHSGFEVSPFGIWSTRVLQPAIHAYLAARKAAVAAHRPSP